MATAHSGTDGPTGYEDTIYASHAATSGQNGCDTVKIDLTTLFPKGLRFFSGTYDAIYVTPNGVMTFGKAHPVPDARALTRITVPALIPFFDETAHADTTQIQCESDPDIGQITVTWTRDTDSSGPMGQVVIRDRGHGNFSVAYHCANIDAARTATVAGFTDGTGTIYELARLPTLNSYANLTAATHLFDVEDGHAKVRAMSDTPNVRPKSTRSSRLHMFHPNRAANDTRGGRAASRTQVDAHPGGPRDGAGVVCFTSGTAIRTPNGDVLIDELQVGDLVTTMDNGPQEIRWIGRRKVDTASLRATPSLRPVLIPKGVLSGERDLIVSRQHGVMVNKDTLARAIQLCGAYPGIRTTTDLAPVTYIHLLFDEHQIIFAENIASESFYPGSAAMQMMGQAPRVELLNLFPALRLMAANTPPDAAYGALARKFMRRREINSSPRDV